MQVVEISSHLQLPPSSEIELANDNTDFLRRVKQVEKSQGTLAHHVETIRTEIIEIGKDIAAIKASIQPKGLPAWIEKIVFPLIVVVIGAMVTAVLRMEFSEIPGIKGDVRTLLKSVGDIQRVQALNSLNSAEQEAKAGQLSNAQIAIRQATDFLQSAKDAHTPAPASFFQDSFDAIRNISQAGVDPVDAHRALVQLASYRSALQPEPATIRDAQWKVISSPLSADQIAKEISEVGGTVFRAATPDVQFFAPAGKSTGGSIKNIALIGGVQELDGLNWSGVTFVGTKIIFRGKFLTSLNNVNFVNCSFIVPNDPSSVPLLEYAALSQSSRLELKPTS